MIKWDSNVSPTELTTEPSQLHWSLKNQSLVSNLETTVVLYYKYWHIYLNTFASSVLYKKKKEEEEEEEKEKTQTIKWSKRRRVNTYDGMTPFIVFICSKERVHKKPREW